ncbi:MAG: flagellar basal body rod protein FlgC [Candidatus Thiodiazotropha sp. (ex Dulcina madagascariensis)]|nr:flagellar basal body rod protein FlgC [Candidatus Thiodiazotropha sp. (ex Epidulcina cf. delphinae)]MCU7922537.1 flagellar basal body rod protein FlgC [Candidatus Thiodiazotropha sp. (ex Dulcina madagascariensis)]MCU7925836.1 flagellar basal body rod protein FlgC [Candidatus Thiodiazotropha sp. (ex Dulcina madagascariensis)]
MDYFTVFDISASGMAVEKARLEIVALNLANTHVANSAQPDGPYTPKRVISGVIDGSHFISELNAQSQALPGVGSKIVAIQEIAGNPRLEYDPENPYSNDDGFVEYPDINPVSEMVTLMESVRSYEANVKALSAARAMAATALEIGRQG